MAEAFLHSYQNTFGPVRDRALEGLRELGPQYIPAFLGHDEDEDHRIARLRERPADARAFVDPSFCSITHTSMSAASRLARSRANALKLSCDLM